MESYMDWVNNHFTNANNSSYLEMYKLADDSIKKFLDDGFDTAWYHEVGKDKHMCISFMRDDRRVFVTFDQDIQRWFIDLKQATYVVINSEGKLVEKGIKKTLGTMKNCEEREE